TDADPGPAITNLYDWLPGIRRPTLFPPVILKVGQPTFRREVSARIALVSTHDPLAPNSVGCRSSRVGSCCETPKRRYAWACALTAASSERSRLARRCSSEGVAGCVRRPVLAVD